MRATGVELGAEAIAHAAVVTSGAMYVFHNIDVFYLKFASFLTMQEKTVFLGQ